MWQVTCDTWQVTRDTWHVTSDMWHVTHDNWCIVNILSKFQLSSSNGLGFLMLWISGGKGSLNQSVSNGGDCRTAPAAPGLLSIWETPNLLIDADEAFFCFPGGGGMDGHAHKSTDRQRGGGTCHLSPINRSHFSTVQQVPFSPVVKGEPKKTWPPET